MKRLRFIILGLVLLWGGMTAAQQPTGPVVGFVLEQDLAVASVADRGPDGVSRLAEIFRGLGAQTRFIRLSEAIPPEVNVVVLARPLRPIPPDRLARLWNHLEKGNHLLLAIDPIGYPDRRIEENRNGLGQLLLQDYGVSFLDAFLAEPWFTEESIVPLEGSITMTYGDYLPHPVIAPLTQYALPVFIWGGRAVTSEPLGIQSFGYGLLVNDTAYAETNVGVFVGGSGQLAPLELNIGEDPQGELLVAGLAENARTGSRVAVLGDSEMVQNGFGLAQTITTTGAQRARFPGNMVLMERLSAWLIGLPEDEWPPLPDGYTWIAIDGDAADWDPTLPLVSDDSDAAQPTRTRTFRNDEYLYLLVEAASTLDEASLSLILTPQVSNTAAVEVRVDSAGVWQLVDGKPALLSDAAVTLSGSTLEARIPLRVVGNNDVLELSRLCLGAGEAADCHDSAFSIPRVIERDPVVLRIDGTPLATINNPARVNVNLRAGPGTDFPPVTGLPNGTIMAALGRDTTGAWLYIENARYAGWIFASLVTLNADLLSLPILSE